MLETEIKKLTVSIDRLSDLLYAGQTITITDGVPAETPPQSTPEKKSVPAETPPQSTPDEKTAAPDTDFTLLREKAKDLCLTLVREDRDNKKLIGAYLVGYGVKTITQLADENIEAFIASMLEIQNAK